MAASRFLERVRKSVEEKVEQIVHLTFKDVELEDDNLQTCVEFAITNLGDHQFPSDNTIEVMRAYEALEDRMERHSQLTKASILRDLKQSLLSADLEKIYPPQKTTATSGVELGHAVLRLLYHLCETPVASSDAKFLAEFDRSELMKKKREEQEIIEGAEMTLDECDGLKDYLDEVDGSSDEEAWDTDEEEQPADGERENVSAKQQRRRDGEGLSKESKKDAADADDDADSFVRVGDADDSNASSDFGVVSIGSDDSVVHSEPEAVPPPTKVVPRLDIPTVRFQDIENSLSQSGDQTLDQLQDSCTFVPKPEVTPLVRHIRAASRPLSLPYPPVVMERRVVREALAMMQGIEGDIFALADDGKFTLRESIALAHASPQGLRNILAGMCDIGTRFLHVSQFSMLLSPSPVHGVTHNGPFRKDIERSVVFQGFASAVDEQLQDFCAVLQEFEMLCEDEKRVDSNPNVAAILEDESRKRYRKFLPTLTSIDTQLRGHFRHIRFLSEFVDDLASVLKEKERKVQPKVLHPSSRTGLLLSQLYTRLEEYYVCGGDCFMAVFRIFKASLFPYLNLLDVWIGEGAVRDKAHELMIDWDEWVTSSSSSYWHSAFRVRGSESKASVSDEERHDSNNENKPEAVPTFGGGGTDRELEGGEGDESYCVPVFLKDTVHEILMCGKSLNLIQSIEKEKDTLYTRHRERPPLSSVFAVSLEKLASATDNSPVKSPYKSAAPFSPDSPIHRLRKLKAKRRSTRDGGALSPQIGKLLDPNQTPSWALVSGASTASVDSSLIPISPTMSRTASEVTVAKPQTGFGDFLSVPGASDQSVTSNQPPRRKTWDSSRVEVPFSMLPSAMAQETTITHHRGLGAALGSGVDMAQVRGGSAGRTGFRHFTPRPYAVSVAVGDGDHEPPSLFHQRMCADPFVLSSVNLLRSNNRWNDSDGTEEEYASLFTQCPPSTIVSKCLVAPIMVEYQKANPHLIRLLIGDCQLMEHLHVLRAYLLMDCGDVMHQFMSTLFARIEDGQGWDDYHEINATFQEAAMTGALYSKAEAIDAIANLSVEFVNKDSRRATNQSVTALDDFRFSYKVDWPLDVVINAESLKRYNRITVFLLRIHRAKWSLEQTRTLRDFQEPPGYHRLRLLRAQLLHFVNNLHNYVMTRVLHKVWDAMEEKLAEATDLEQVISIHQHALDKMRDRCLLQSRASLMMDYLQKILNLTLKFRFEHRKLMKCSVESETHAKVMKEVDRIASEFRQCNRFLYTVLSKGAEKGTQPHLEDMLCRLNFNRFYGE